MAKRSPRSKATQARASDTNEIRHAPPPPADDSTRADSMSSEPPAVSPSRQLADDEIRARAYQRYLERGGSDGQDFDDWIEAEQDLRKP
jgi:hypothetical protein